MARLSGGSFDTSEAQSRAASRSDDADSDSGESSDRSHGDAGGGSFGSGGRGRFSGGSSSGSSSTTERTTTSVGLTDSAADAAGSASDYGEFDSQEIGSVSTASDSSDRSQGDDDIGSGDSSGRFHSGGSSGRFHSGGSYGSTGRSSTTERTTTPTRVSRDVGLTATQRDVAVQRTADLSGVTRRDVGPDIEPVTQSQRPERTLPTEPEEEPGSVATAIGTALQDVGDSAVGRTIGAGVDGVFGDRDDRADDGFAGVVDDRLEDGEEWFQTTVVDPLDEADPAAADAETYGGVRPFGISGEDVLDTATETAELSNVPGFGRDILTAGEAVGRAGQFATDQGPDAVQLGGELGAAGVRAAPGATRSAVEFAVENPRDVGVTGAAVVATGGLATIGLRSGRAATRRTAGAVDDVTTRGTTDIDDFLTDTRAQTGGRRRGDSDVEQETIQIERTVGEQRQQQGTRDLDEIPGVSVERTTRQQQDLRDADSARRAGRQQEVDSPVDMDLREVGPGGGVRDVDGTQLDRALDAAEDALSGARSQLTPRQRAEQRVPGAAEFAGGQQARQREVDRLTQRFRAEGDTATATATTADATTAADVTAGATAGAVDAGGVGATTDAGVAGIEAGAGTLGAFGDVAEDTATATDQTVTQTLDEDVTTATTVGTTTTATTDQTGTQDTATTTDQTVTQVVDVTTTVAGTQAVQTPTATGVTTGDLAGLSGVDSIATERARATIRTPRGRIRPRDPPRPSLPDAPEDELEEFDIGAVTEDVEFETRSLDAVDQDLTSGVFDGP